MNAEDRCLQTLLLLLFASSAIGAGDGVLGEEPGLTPGDLTVLDAPSADMMKNYLTSLVDEQFARRNATLSKLHTACTSTIAAAIDDSVSGLVLEEPLLSFESVVTVKAPTYRNDILVPRIFESLHLPHVYQAGFPRRVSLIDPLRGDQIPASGIEVAETYQPVSDTYGALGKPGGWRVFAQIDKQERSERILSAFTAGSPAK